MSSYETSTLVPGIPNVKDSYLSRSLGVGHTQRLGWRESLSGSGSVEFMDLEVCFPTFESNLEQRVICMYAHELRGGIFHHIHVYIYIYTPYSTYFMYVFSHNWVHCLSCFLTLIGYSSSSGLVTILWKEIFQRPPADSRLGKRSNIEANQQKLHRIFVNYNWLLWRCVELTKYCREPSPCSLIFF